jgi:DNA-binding response OmpR family regulator
MLVLVVEDATLVRMFMADFLDEAGFKVSDDLSDKVAFLAKPYLPDTIIAVIRQMATPQVVELPSAQSA